MGVYYQVANYDKKELIDLYTVANIKFSAFSRWSLQGAILNTFLGFGWAYFGERHELNEWVGRWRLNRVQIQSDADDDSDERDDEQEGWPDAGMLFLAFLDSRNLLDAWIAYAGLTQEWDGMEGTKDLRKWVIDQAAESRAKKLPS